jgi:hypothetical protein
MLAVAAVVLVMLLVLRGELEVTAVAVRGGAI